MDLRFEGEVVHPAGRAGWEFPSIGKETESCCPYVCRQQRRESTRENDSKGLDWSLQWEGAEEGLAGSALLSAIVGLDVSRRH